MHVYLKGLLVLQAALCLNAALYVLDDTNLGRKFDGIGGLSGGGATSRLLVDYPEQQLKEILDLLFLPKFGASLNILKVEIGGDAQSTDGTEPSHMHSADDLSYKRGYEWWLMTEAKKRNPDIKLYALPWAFPAWVGQTTDSPYTNPVVTSNYVISWIKGAKENYGLDIDYVGIWNERSYNTTYIKTLRKFLDMNKLNHVEIVAADGAFEPIASDVMKDSELAAAVAILGAHYPGTISSANAKATQKPLWASEDYSTFNDDVGAGCFARIVNQNYVNGNMTSTISWNLIASYYNGLPYYRDGLMTAVEPWSGHYDVMGPVWVTAHTTQFSEVGYHYLKHEQGAGQLFYGGSYVTLVDPDTKDFSLIIETMSHNNSKCIRPPLPQYAVQPQNATFSLKGDLIKFSTLNKWVSRLYFNGSQSQYFVQEDQIMVNDSGLFTLFLEVDTVVTISTLSGQKKGSFDDVPSSKPFPLPYNDSFNDYNLYSEARYFADQTGVFEIQDAKDEEHGKVMRQTVPARPITWCNDASQTVTLMGNNTWKNVEVNVSVFLESSNTSAFVASSISQGGCDIAKATGVFLWISDMYGWKITSDIQGVTVVSSGTLQILPKKWYALRLLVKNGFASAFINNKLVTLAIISDYKPGFVGFGTGGFYPVQFDDFLVMEAKL